MSRKVLRTFYTIERIYLIPEGLEDVKIEDIWVRYGDVKYKDRWVEWKSVVDEDTDQKYPADMEIGNLDDTAFEEEDFKEGETNLKSDKETTEDEKIDSE